MGKKYPFGTILYGGPLTALNRCNRSASLKGVGWGETNAGSFNLSNGFLPSTSKEICDEIALVFPKVIAEDPIPLEKQGQDHAKIVDVERIKPITQVFSEVELVTGLSKDPPRDLGPAIAQK